jgi:hypothetical protein
VSNVLGSFRQAIVAELATNLQGGDFTVVSGKRDGPARDRNLACVYPGPFQLDQDRAFLRPTLVIRAWKPKPKQPRTESPPDPTELEQLMLDLFNTLTPIRKQPALSLTFEFAGQGEFDLDDWGVQVLLVGWTARALP